MLPIVFPLLAALVGLILQKGRVELAAMAIVVNIILIIMAIPGAPHLYDMGGWEFPIGIQLKIDSSSLAILLFINVSALISLTAGSTGRLAVILLFLISGLSGIVLSHDLFNIYVFIEISSLASYIMVACSREKGALVAAFEYLIAGTVGATFYLIGVGFLYIKTGSLNIDQLYYELQAIRSDPAVYLAFVFIFIGLIIKVGVIPMQNWLVKSYVYAPAAYKVFSSMVVTKVPIILLLKIIIQVFGIAFIPHYMIILIYCLGAVSIILAAIIAMYQQDVYSILAYSSVSNLGYILVLLAIGIQLQSFVPLIIFILNHSLSKGALMFAASNQSAKLSKATFFVGSLSLIGIPLTYGFIAKINFLIPLFILSNYLMLAVLILGSIMSGVYIYKAFTLNLKSDELATLEKPKVFKLLVNIMFIVALVLIVPSVGWDWLEGVSRSFLE